MVRLQTMQRQRSYIANSREAICTAGLCPVIERTRCIDIGRHIDLCFVISQSSTGSAVFTNLHFDVIKSCSREGIIRSDLSIFLAALFRIEGINRIGYIHRYYVVSQVDSLSVLYLSRQTDEGYVSIIGRIYKPFTVIVRATVDAVRDNTVRDPEDLVGCIVQTGLAPRALVVMELTVVILLFECEANLGVLCIGRERISIEHISNLLHLCLVKSILATYSIAAEGLIIGIEMYIHLIPVHCVLEVNRVHDSAGYILLCISQCLTGIVRTHLHLDCISTFVVEIVSSNSIAVLTFALLYVEAIGRVGNVECLCLKYHMTTLGNRRRQVNERYVRLTRSKSGPSTYVVINTTVDIGCLVLIRRPKKKSVRCIITRIAP